MIKRKLKDITDEELVSSLISKDRDAMGILYDKYSGFLFGVISRIIQNESTAEDVLQEAFVKIWKNILSYDQNKGKLITWMANISRNLAIDKIRSKGYKNSKQNQDIENYVNIIEDKRNDTFKPENIGVREMLEKLLPEQKIIIDMVYFQGYTQSDVSEKLGIPLGTVKTRIRSAISHLRKLFT